MADRDMTDSDEEREQNSKLISAIRRNDLQTVKHLIGLGVKVNAVDKNNKGNAPLHYALEKGRMDIARFLLNHGADLNIKNDNEKRPLEIAVEGKNFDIGALMYRVNVPADGSCLFWAVALAYLTPVRDEQKALKERIDELFGSITLTQTETVQNFIRTYDPLSNNAVFWADEILRRLVTVEFRNRVMGEIAAHKSDYEEFISVHHFLHSKNADYVVGGTFQERFCSMFNSTEIIDIDTSKLKPNTLTEVEIKQIISEFDNIQDKVKVKQFVFENYLECMRSCKSWGGYHELKAITQLLRCNICVFLSGTPQYIDYDDNINKHVILFNNGEVHYEFGLVRSAIYNESIDNQEKRHCRVAPIQSNWQQENDTDPRKHISDLSAQRPASLPANKNPQAGSLQGIDFELWLLMLFITSEMDKHAKNGNHSFVISTQEPSAKSIEDVILKYRDSESENYKLRFLQSKHQINPKNITAKELLKPDGDFSLLLYCNAYLEIKKQEMFKEDVVEDIILATNRRLKLENETSAKLHGKEFYFTEIPMKCDVLRVGSSKLYQFVQEPSNIDRVISDLVKVLNLRKKKRSCDEAFANASPNKKNVELGLLKELNSTELKKEIGLFLEKLVLAVNLPKESDLEEIAKRRVKSIMFEFEDVDMIFHDFQARVSNIRKALLVSPISNDYCEEMFRKIKQNVTKLSLIPYDFKKDNIKFIRQISGLKDFIIPYILNVIATEKDEVTSIVKNICNVFKTDGDVTTQYFKNPSKSFQMKVFKLDTHLEVLIVQNHLISKRESEKLYSELSNFMKKGNEKKVVLVSLKNEEKHSQYFRRLLIKDFQYDYKEITVEGFDNYELYEKSVDDFLTPEKQIFNIISQPQETKLCGYKVFQCLEGIPKHVLDCKKYDSFIYEDLTSLVDEFGTHKKILAFESDKNPYLLVIECKEYKCKGNIKALYNQLSKILSNRKKKIILITKANDSLAAKFKNDFPERYDETENSENNFSDLTIRSQKHLLENGKVTFQGEEVSLGTLINDKSKYIIDGGVLSELIEKEKKIEIGAELSKLGEVENYYINREFIRGRTFRQECLKAKIRDLFVIRIYPHEREREKLSELISKKETIHRFEDIDPDNIKSVRFISEYDDDPDNFTLLCQNYPNFDIHWLFKEECNSLVWHNSQGALSKLSKYAKASEFDKTYTENEFIRQTFNDKHDSKGVIISALPGMGKTTVLTYLARKIKHIYSSKWVIRVNSYDLIDKLSEVDIRNGDEDECLATLLNISGELEKRIFLYRLREEGGVVLLLDGFDEICPDYKEKIIYLLKFLRNTQADRVFVSTRGYKQNELMDAFSTMPFTLQKFSQDDQKLFLKTFWQEKLNLNFNEPSNNLKFEKYSDYFLESFSKSISDTCNAFASVPLLLEMLAEIYGGKFKNFYDSEVLEIPDHLSLEHIDLLTLYEDFVERKHDRYHLEKQKRCRKYPGTIKEINVLKENFVCDHKLLAMCRLLSESETKLLLTRKQRQQLQLLMRSIRSGEEKTGLVDNIFGDKPYFVHLSFAEYFLMELIYDKLQRRSSAVNIWDFLINEILVYSKYRNVRRFFEIKLARDPVLANLTSQISHQEIVLKLLREQSERDGETFLGVAATENLVEIIKLLLKNIDNLDTLIQIMNGGCYSYRGETPLSAAVAGNHKEVVEILMKSIKDIDPDRSVEVINVGGNEWDHPLHNAVQNSREDIVQILLSGIGNDQIIKIFSFNSSDSGRTVLHIAADTCNIDIILEYLSKLSTKQCMELFSITDFQEDKTPAHYAAVLSDFEFFDALYCLLTSEDFRKLCTTEDGYGSEPLCLFSDRVNNSSLYQALMIKLEEKSPSTPV